MRKGDELPENQQELVVISPSFTGIHLEHSNQASDVLKYENLNKVMYTSAHDKENPYEVKRIAGYFHFLCCKKYIVLTITRNS